MVFRWLRALATRPDGARRIVSAGLGSVLAASTLAVVVGVTAGPASATPTTVTFSYAGAAQNWSVPSGVTAITVDARGAQGGGSYGGLGGEAIATISVTPGETLVVNVGGAGTTSGGFNGGGGCTFGCPSTGVEGGGGGSDVRQGGSALTNRVVVGGGGGGGGQGPLPYSMGGSGGGTTGEPGSPSAKGDQGGGAGNQSGGGASNGYGAAGTAGQGGYTYEYAGGGGGGWYGGAGGTASLSNYGSGGGGGSSYAESSASSVALNQGMQTGNGSVTITYPPGTPPVAPLPGSAVFNETGGPQYWTVPAGITSIAVTVLGAQGGGAEGGLGGMVQAMVPVTPGQSIVVMVGGAGSTSGGFNGGGGCYFGCPGTYVEGGGGESDVRVGGFALGDRVAVAGGGGGEGTPAAAGGAGGGTTGLVGTNSTRGDAGGQPGTQTAPGGASDYGTPGVAGGGGAVYEYSGSGGAGWWGGGGGNLSGPPYAGGGGGGGSSYPPPSASVVNVAGQNYGNGQVTIDWPASAGFAQLDGRAVTAADVRGGGACSAPQVPYLTVADPVDPGTGVYTEGVTDLATKGRGMGLNFDRTYNSDTAATTGPLGSGWTDAYNMSLAFGSGTPPSTATVTEDAGSQVVFDYNSATASYAPDVPRDSATLTQNSSGPAWTYTCRGTSVYDFNASGQLIDEHDLNANTTTIVIRPGIRGGSISWK